MKIVGNRRRKRRAEHRDRRGENEPWTIAAAGRPKGVEQRARTVEIDRQGLLEVEFGLSGHHPRQMKNRGGAAGDGCADSSRIGNVSSRRLDFAGKFSGWLR